MNRFLVSIFILLFAINAWAFEAKIKWPTTRALYQKELSHNSQALAPTLNLGHVGTAVPSAPMVFYFAAGPPEWGNPDWLVTPASYSCLRLCGTNRLCILECMNQKDDG
jgi:hypothetical protein